VREVGRGKSRVLSRPMLQGNGESTTERESELGEVPRAVLARVVHKLRTVKVGHRITDSGIVAWMCGEGLAVAELRYGARWSSWMIMLAGQCMSGASTTRGSPACWTLC